ncbi:unnamed protein product, partial [Tetraodon nigroviridis]
MSVRDGAATVVTNVAGGGGGGRPGSPNNHDSRSYLLQIYPRLVAQPTSCCNLRVHKDATAASVISDVAAVLGLDPARMYVLAEVKESGGEEWVLEPGDLPAQRFLLWPRKAQEQHPQSLGFYFLLQERNRDGTIHYVHLPSVAKEQEAQQLTARGFLPPPQDEFADLCNLPVLSEDSILNNLRTRFYKKKIYTYAGSILIAINPFMFLPIYNPKYVKMYENHQLGKLEPHIFAIADVAYYAMLRKKVNQCIVISGESGSGKTQSTNFLIHCLTALSQKGYASGVERTILGAGPVLEAFHFWRSLQKHIIYLLYFIPPNRQSQPGTLWPNLCTVPCLTGLYYALIMHCLTRKIWRNQHHVCPLVFWTFLALRILRPTALSSSALTMQTNSCNIISTTTFSIWSSFPHATDETLLAKFKQQHQGNKYFVPTPVMEPAFVIKHFAGKVKYQIKDFREKNTDHMRSDIVALLRSSDSAYVRQLIGMDPVAMFRWGILRATIRGLAAFNEAGRARAAKTSGVLLMSSCSVSSCRTPLGELKQSNASVDRMYKRVSMLDFYFDHSEERPLEAFEDIFASYENKKNMHAEIISSIKNLQLDGEDPRKLLQSWGRLRFPRHILQKQKHTKHRQAIPKSLLDSRSLKFIVGLTLHDRTTKSLLHLHKKKKPPSISAQFQTSLTKLLETLNRAEPFFIRCIRSNAQKKEMYLDEALVIQQLRYTGMLETVRIRRSGYGAKYTFQEFVNQFRVLLPKYTKSFKEDISELLEKKMGLDPATYQIGKTKVFLKELGRQKLQDTLHKDVMRKIIFLQRWFRARLQRKEFLDMRQAAILIQCSWRRYHKEEQRRRAATLIQAMWRGHWQRSENHRKKQVATKIQALYRGHSARRRCQSLREEKLRKEEEEKEAQKRAEEEERRRREEEEEARIRAEEEEERRRLEDEKARIKAEEEAKARAEKEEIARMAEEAEKSVVKEPQTREDPDIELITEEMLDDNLAVLEMEEEVNTSSHTEDKHVKGGELNDVDMELEVNGTPAEAGPQLEERDGEDDLESGTPAESDSTSVLSSDGVFSPQTSTAGEDLDNKSLDDASTLSNIDQSRTQSTAVSKGQLSRSQEKRELRRLRGLEHNQRETERASSSVSGKDDTSSLKNKTQATRLKERSESKELDQYTFVAWKMKEDKTAKKETKTSPSPAGPVRPSTLPLQPVSDRNGVSEGTELKQPCPQLTVCLLAQKELVLVRSGGFLSKILKKRPHKEAQTPDNGELTLAQILSERPAGGEAPNPGSLSWTLSQPQGDRAVKGLGRNPTIKISRATRVSEQWNASLDREITNANELRHLDEFLGNQVNDFRTRGKSLSATESIFVTATMDFRKSIKAMYSFPKPTIGYKSLMSNYQNRVIHLAGDKQKGEVKLVVNLFQSVLDGFIRGEMKKEEAEPAKPAKARKKRSKDKSMESPLDHSFSNYQVSIMQSCDQCSSYIWAMDKAYMCTYCKMVCHKKCLCKITTDCSTFSAKKCDEESTGQHFGVRVCHLVNDKNPVPMVLEMMLEHVEMHGLYTEGIYRKSGSANRMKELHQRLESEPHSVCLEDYPIHTVTGLVKQWLRELPDPLMTFMHYNDFLHATDLPEKQEQLQAIYKVIEELPPANFITLERLIFHLVRVCKVEAHNRMSPNSLAIVFAPCVLRCPDSADPLLSMKDVAKTTICVEMIINEQIRRYNEKMEEIDQLEYAEALAVNQLKLKRQNTHCWHLPLRFSPPYKGVVVCMIHSTVVTVLSDLSVVPENEPLDSDTEAEKNLVERIKSIKQEKEDLACRLPEMEQPGSDQENLDSETSQSSESLLDELQRSSVHSSEPDGGQVSLWSLTPASSASSVSSSASSTSGSSSTYSRRPLQRRRAVLPDTVKLPPGVPLQSASSPQTPSRNWALSYFRKKDQPGRRNDSTQSLYID